MPSHGGNSTLEKWRKHQRRPAAKANPGQGHPRGMWKITDAERNPSLSRLAATTKMRIPQKGLFLRLPLCTRDVPGARRSVIAALCQGQRYRVFPPPLRLQNQFYNFARSTTASQSVRYIVADRF